MALALRLHNASRLFATRLLARSPVLIAPKTASTAVAEKKGEHGHGHHGKKAMTPEEHERHINTLQEWENYYGYGIENRVSVLKQIWREQNSIYYGQQRDHVNFPAPRTNGGDFPVGELPRTRMYFLPESWFNAFYDRTGVTGPYLFLFTSVTYLLSKEVIVFDHVVCEWTTFVLFVSLVVRRFGKRIGAFLQRVDKRHDELLQQPLEEYKHRTKENIATLESYGASLEKLQNLLTEAKKEQVDLQVEAKYRERLVRASEEVRNRLDYLTECEQVRKRHQQQHLLNWVTSEVKKSITPKVEKETIQACLNDLRALSQAQAKHV